MADMKTTYSRQGGRYVAGYRGARAGESFGTGAEVAAQKQQEDDWTAFAKSLGMNPAMFSGLGGGAARAKHRGQFDTWKAKRTGTLKDLMGGG